MVRDVVKKFCGANGNDSTINVGPDTLAGNRLGQFNRLDDQAAVLGAADNCVGKGVLGGSFSACRKEKNVVLRVGRVQRFNIRELRPTVRQGARLINNNGVDPGSGLQVFAALDEDAVLRGASDAGNDRDRDRDNESAGATDDKEGQSKLNVLGDQTDDESENHDARGVPGGELLHEGLRLCLVILSVLDAVDDLCKRGVRTNAHGFDTEQTCPQPGSRKHLRTGRLLGRDGFDR